MKHLLSLLLVFSVLHASGQGRSQSLLNPTLGMKRHVDCKAFELQGIDFNKQPAMRMKDSSMLPHDFPEPPKGSSLCGCHTLTGTTYFQATQTEGAIFTHYKQALKAKGYTVYEIEGGTKPDDYILRYEDKTGGGYIYTYGDKYAFSIVYHLTKRGCNCGRKANADAAQ